MNNEQKNSQSHAIWDAFCIASIVGIWPRFIEPSMLYTNYLTLKIKDLPEALYGLRILQMSDLHLNDNIKDSFLKKIQKKSEEFSPDIIAFTGDFICRGQMDKKTKDRLTDFLTTFPKARYGAFAVLGNHDYDEFVSVNDQGEYAITATNTSPIRKGFKRIFSRSVSPKAMQINVHDVALNEELLAVLAKTPFRLLHNVSATVPINGSAVNIAGVGEYSLGRFDPENAFRLWDDRFPGIVLAHNPDCTPFLKDFPGSVVLAGHTHGGQINLPFINKKFLVMENPGLKSGMIHTGNKWLYVNRGIGGLMHFRWFAPPELLCLTLVPA